MSLQVPDYIIDERLIIAIRRNVTTYLTSYFENSPQHLSCYYFHLSTKTDCGIFEKLFYSPTKYILTPVGFAVLYDCEKSLTYLLKKGANPNMAGVAVDCPVEDEKMRWKIDLFRLHEVYPVCLTVPGSPVFSKLVEYGLKLSIDYRLRFRLVTMEETKERMETSRGVWELAWIFWIKMRDPVVLLKTTESLIANGMNATYIMERVNLLPLLKKIYKLQKDDIPNVNESSYIIDLLKMLLYNGCDFDNTKLAEYIYPCVNIFFKDTVLINSTQSDVINKYKILQGVANLSKVFRSVLTEKKVWKMKIACLNETKFMSLQVIAIRTLRRYLTGILFAKKLSMLNLDASMKEVVQTVIPTKQNDQFLIQLSTLKSERSSISGKQKSFVMIDESDSVLEPNIELKTDIITD